MNRKQLARLSVIALLVCATQFLTYVKPLVPSASSQASGNSSIFYKFDIIAQTDPTNLKELSAPSINDKGAVAFVGQHDNGAENIFVGDGTQDPQNITLFASPDRRIASVQINNSNRMVASDRIRDHSLTRIWDTNGGDSIIARGPGRYAATLGASSINNNNDVVFNALAELKPDSSIIPPECIPLCPLIPLDPLQTAICLSNCYESAIPVITPVHTDECEGLCLVTVDPNGDSNGFFEETIRQSARPLIADDRRIVVGVGLQNGFAIRLYDYDLSTFTEIANSDMGFTDLGNSPGISDNGQAIAFYGVLDSIGANQLDPGPGIFVAVELHGEWTLQRVAGIAGDGFLDAGERWIDNNRNGSLDVGEDEGPFSGFIESSRVGVNFRANSSVVMIAFMALDTSGKPGLYTSSWSLDPNYMFLSSPSLVTKVDARLPRLTGVVQDLSIYDPINTRGQIAFWAETDDGTQVVIRATPSLRPVLIVPGIAGTFPEDGEFETWLMERGVAPEHLQIDPLKHVYHDLIHTLENAGYEQGKTLFVANYDWRMPPGPNDGVIDGHVDGLSSLAIADNRFEYGVDYLGYWLRKAAEAWEEEYPDAQLDAVDVIAHSTGGLIVRTYMQSDAYGGPFLASNIHALELPKVNTFIMIAVPNRGASKAWNPLHNNWALDIAYRLVLSKLIAIPYKRVVEYGEPISGPGEPITVETITNAQGQPDPVIFIEKYVPTIRSLLATYPFIDFGFGVTSINNNPLQRNDLILDLNDGLDMWPDNIVDSNTFVEKAGKVIVVYASKEETATTVTQYRGALSGNPLNHPFRRDRILPFTDFYGHVPTADEIWYADNVELLSGDGTVPTLSAIGQFVGDGRVEIMNFDYSSSYEFTTGDVSHTGLVSNESVQRYILEKLGFSREDIQDIEIETGGDTIGWSHLRTVVRMAWDPVNGFLIDANGKRLGYSQATGPVTEIPNSVWFGGNEGIGWILGAYTAPLELQLTGLGEDYEVHVYTEQGTITEDHEFTGFLAEGQQQSFVIPVPPTYGDNTEPTVGIISPTPGTLIPLGHAFTVTLTATDNVAVDSIAVSLDIDGDGRVDDPGETVSATSTGPDTYEATFVNISGPRGPRTVHVSAQDTAGNLGVANRTVIIGDSTQGDGAAPSVRIQTPASGVLTPLNSDLTIRMTVTGNLEISSVTVLFDTDGDGVINRFGEFARARQVGTGVYEARFPDISGPAGTRLVHAYAVDASLNVGMDVAIVSVGDTTPPHVRIDWPTPGLLVPLGADVTLSFTATDDIQVDTITAAFDINGDGTLGGPGETTMVSSPGPDPHEITFASVSGPTGPRTIRVSATDPSLNTSVISRTVTIGDSVPIVGLGTSVPYEMIFGLGKIASVAFSPDGRKALLGGSQGFVALVDLSTGASERRFLGHTDEVTSVAFSPDGTMALTGSKDGTARLWDVASGALLHVFSHTGEFRSYPVTSVAFSPEGRWIVTGTGAGGGSRAWLWDANSGQFIRYFDGHTGDVLAVAFSPDGSQVLTGSRDRTARLWETATGRYIRTFSGHPLEVNSVAFSPGPNSAQIITGSPDGTARLWDVTTGSFVSLPRQTGGVRAVSISPDGHLALTSDGATARLWDAQTGELIHIFKGHTLDVLAVAFSPDGSRMLTGSADGTARLWSTAVDAELVTLTGHTGDVNAVAVAALPDGTQLLLSGSNDKSARLWNAETGEQLQLFEGHRGSVLSVAISPDGTRALTGADGTPRDGYFAHLWDVSTGEELHKFEGFTQGILAVAFSPDGSRALIGSRDGRIQVWDLETDSPVLVHSLDFRNAQVIAFSPDGRYVLRNSGTTAAEVWDIANAELRHTLAGSATAASFSPDGSQVLIRQVDSMARLWDLSTHSSRLLPEHNQQSYSYSSKTVAFSPDGARLLTTDEFGVRLWDAATGDLLGVFTEHADGVNAVAFSPDGRQVIMAGADDTVRLRSAAAGITLHTFKGSHTHFITSVAFSSDGTRALTGSYDGTARLWDATTGDPVHVLVGHFLGGQRTQVNAVAISPDGATLLTAGPYGEVRVWDTSTDSILRTIVATGTNAIRAVAFSPDGTQILTGDADGQNRVRLWDATTGAWKHTFEGHTAAVNAVAFSPDGTRILSGGDDNVALLWNLNSKRMLASFGGHGDGVKAVAFSPTGSYVLTGGGDGIARLWNPAQSSQPLQLYEYDRPVTSAAFGVDDDHVLTGYQVGTAGLWDAATGQLLRVYDHPAGGATIAVFSADGSHVLITSGASCGGAGYCPTARLWKAITKPVVHTFAEPNLEGSTDPLEGRSIDAVAWSPDGSEVLTLACRHKYPAPGHSTARLWRTDGTPIHALFEEDTVPSCSGQVSFSPDGSYILTGDITKVRLWDADTGQLLRTIVGHNYALDALAFSPDSNWIITGGQDQNPATCTRNCASAKLWDVHTGVLERTFSHAARVTSVAFSPDGERLLTGSQDSRARLWDVNTQNEIRVLEGHMEWVTAVAYSPDGTRVLTGSQDKTVRLWDVATGRLLHIYSHPDAIKTVAFAPHGQWIVAAAGHSAYVWDAIQGGLVFAVGHTGLVTSAILSPDGTHLLTGGSDGRAQLWAVEE